MRHKAIASGLGIFLGACAAWLHAGQTGITQFKPNPQNPFNYAVVAEGRVLPKGKIVRVTSPDSGPAVVHALHVQVNQSVRKGDLLATLQTKALWDAQAQLAQAEADQAQAVLEQSRAESARARAEFEAQTQVLEYTVSAAKGNLEAAQAAADSELALLEQKIEQAKRTVEELTAQQKTLEEEQTAAVAVAQASLEATRAAKETKILQAQLDQATAASVRARQDFQSQLNNAKNAVVELQNRYELAKRKDAVTQANLELTKAQSALQAKQGVKAAFEAVLEFSEKQAQAALQSANAALAQAQAQAALGAVRAPQDGTILALYTYPGESIGTQGLCELADTKNLEIQAQVYIDDISRVKLEAPAQASGPGINGKLTGKVVEISRQVVPNTVFQLDPAAFSDQRIVLVRIALDDPEKAAHVLNAQVTVSIEP